MRIIRRSNCNHARTPESFHLALDDFWPSSDHCLLPPLGTRIEWVVDDQARGAIKYWPSCDPSRRCISACTDRLW